MDIKDLIAKITGNEAAAAALGEEGLKALTGLTSGGTDLDKKLKDAEAKAGRILAEKKELQERLASFESEIEALKTSKLSDSDKVKAETDKAMKRAEKAEKDFQALQAEFGKAKRAVALDKVVGQVKFIDAMTPEAGRVLLEASLVAVQDLNDVDAVAAALSAFKEGHKTLIAADSQATGAGTGRPGASSAGASGSLAAVEKMTAQEREKDLKQRGIL